jgi:hypothetical protein
VSDQLSLLEPGPPMVRHTDPPTSRAAAKSVAVNDRQRECLQGLAWLGGRGTAEDVARALAGFGFTREKNCVSKRLGELEKVGRVRRAGSEPGATGRQQTVWAAT